MIPIIGPTNISFAESLFFVDRVVRYRQAKPFNLILPYSRRVGIGSASGSPYLPIHASISLDLADTFMSEQRTHVLNRAYDEFKNQMGSTASLGVTIAQFDQASSMIAGRAGQMRQFISALRRADIPGAARALKAPLPPQTRKRMEKYSRSKSLSSQILEWNFGWVPTVSDIYKSCEILTSEPVFKKVRARASKDVTSENLSTLPSASNQRIRLLVRGEIGANLRVENPNLRLLNQLGLANPLTFAYELIPWSFLLGWVSNVEQVLSSYTDFLGVGVTDAYTTVSFRGVHSSFWNPPSNTATSCSVIGVDRSPGLYKPVFHFKPLRFSPTRAANAISLLLLQMPKR